MNPDRPIPLIALRNTVVFPRLSVPLRVGRARSVQALKEAQKAEDPIVFVALESAPAESVGDPLLDSLQRVGVLAKLEKVSGNETEGYRVLIRGLERYRLSHIVDQGSFFVARGEIFPDRGDLSAATAAALLESMKKLAGEILQLLPADTDQLSELLKGITDLDYLTGLVATNLPSTPEEKQRVLETPALKDRALVLLEMMQKQRDDLKVQTEIQQKVTSKFGRAHRESILREQMKAIQEELGEGDRAKSEDYATKIRQAKMPPEVEKTALDELRRLEAAGNGSPEAQVIRNYLDLLCAMPWSVSASNEIDLDRARQVLDEDHAGLAKIKQRIIEHLAVMKLKKGGKGSILLFVGPPGVGKTSLGQSIARALGRKFARVSLGGVRDDAEIRGHRRTYVGAMPGRIIQSIRRAGENNPLMMLDEVDKLARGFHGDPAAALLEVLDPEQNFSFVDHYLDVPFDLSKTFFISTANTVDSIPGPLLDRMEIVELSGYTTAEKLHIAKRHLIPKQLAEHGITTEQLQITDETLLRLITSYTREAGVRELQRRIAHLCRASSEGILTPGTRLPVIVQPEDLERIIGPEKFIHEVAERGSSPGMATGLAWTPQGGEILFIEAALMPGSGHLTLTGQLGEVMKESAQIAFSHVRSKLAPILPSPIAFEKNDLHVHVPAGAIPKDGPSAGVAMLTTIASLFTGRNVDPQLAMTGEITLRGTVLPVGGIKEKVLAAHRAGITTVILPKRNQPDLRDVPEEVRSQLKFHWVENVSEVLRIALGIEAVAGVPLTTKSPPSAQSPAAVA